MESTRSIIRGDLYRCGGLTGFIGFWKGFMTMPQFRFMFFFRLGTRFSSIPVISLFFRIIIKFYSYRYGFQIYIPTKIGKGFYIGHHGTIVINAKTVIGDYCNVTHNVTIGQISFGKNKGTPIIGNKVWLGTGSVIVGGINIGSNVLIAPNSYVNFDVPDNSLVIGNPAKIIRKDNPTENYINFTI